MKPTQQIRKHNLKFTLATLKLKVAGLIKRRNKKFRNQQPEKKTHLDDVLVSLGIQGPGVELLFDHVLAVFRSPVGASYDFDCNLLTWKLK